MAVKAGLPAMVGALCPSDGLAVGPDDEPSPQPDRISAAVAANTPAVIRPCQNLEHSLAIVLQMSSISPCKKSESTRGRKHNRGSRAALLKLASGLQTKTLGARLRTPVWQPRCPGTNPLDRWLCVPPFRMVCLYRRQFSSRTSARGGESVTKATVTRLTSQLFVQDTVRV